VALIAAFRRLKQLGPRQRLHQPLLAAPYLKAPGPAGGLLPTAIQRYMNANEVPQLFIGSGATKWNDPQHFSWTMGLLPSYKAEGRIFAHYLLNNHPNSKIGVLYQNDDYGKGYVKGFKDELRGKIPITAEAPYETTDTTVDLRSG
jgi:branched-chain amino acid transport system substrate-binding protein